MRSDNHTHQWGACRRPVIIAGEKEGNHLPLLFRELHTAGNRGFIRAMQEYGMALYPQRITDVAGGNGGAFTWGILTLYRMKPLSGRPAESRKPWTRFYGITANESALPPLKTGTSTQTPRTA